MKDYERAAAIIRRNPEKARFAGPRPESLIRAAEKKLRIQFPPSYRRFLAEFGAGDFDSSEIYGVIDNKWDSRPDAVKETLYYRGFGDTDDLPNNFVMVYDLGDSQIFCIKNHKSKRKGAEGPVVSFQPGAEAEHQSFRVIAPDFGKFLLDTVKLWTKRK